MADLRSLSVPEILAHCRNADGEGGGAAAPAASEPVAAAPEPTVEAAQAAAPASPAAPADRGKMSVADMLAAARGEKAGGAATPAAAAVEPAAAKPAAAAPAAPVDRSKMSVADMMAAARGEKAGGAPAPKPKAGGAKAAPKAKPAAAKAAPAKAAKTGPMDTSSILAAARAGSAKPGPITKAEAAQRAKDGGTPKSKTKEKPKAPPMPAKPDYAQPVVTKAKATSDRRSFIEICFGSALAVGWGAMTMAAGLASLMTARFFFPNLLVEPPSQFKVGFPGDFSAGTVATKFKAQFGVWVVNADYEGQQQIVALKSVCTHLGCTPNWLEAEQKFKCPCHGSGFYKEGINFEGPAPRPLERYAISVADDGQIQIDKSKTFQEQLGQWNDGASFVSV